MMQTIEIHTQHGLIEKQNCLVRNGFALHEIDDGYNVTHLKTGYCVNRKPLAMFLACVLFAKVQNYKLNGTPLRELDLDTILENGRELKKQNNIPDWVTKS